MKQGQQQEQITEAILAAYDKLPERERDELDRVIDRVIDLVQLRGFGGKSATEVIGKIGIYLVTHPNVEFNAGQFDRPARALQT
jgi:hypothetical protein